MAGERVKLEEVGEVEVESFSQPNTPALPMERGPVPSAL